MSTGRIVGNHRKTKHRLMIVDDHPLLRGGIAALIENEPDLEVCGESENVDDALALAHTSLPDLVIVDLTLAEGNGLDLVKRLASGDASPAILVCSMHDESLFAPRALAAGAQGYLSKKEAPTNLISAIRRILSGRIYLSERMDKHLQQKTGHPAGIQGLSDRELAVFELIGRGQGPSEIARQLYISVKTVESHRENIKKKLQLDSGMELTRHALQWVMEHG